MQQNPKMMRTVRQRAQSALPGHSGLLREPLESPVPPTTPKHTLRHDAKQRLSELSPTEQAEHARSLAPHLLADPAITSASAVLAYASFPPELSLDPFITPTLEQHKIIAIPSIDWARKSMRPMRITNLHTDLQPGRYGIRVPADGCAPIDPAQLDVILLPGLAFDHAGRRLGRGAGFYDRYISALHEAGHKPTLIGVCHHAQIVDSVPTEPHDHRVDRVITELGPLDPV